MSEYIEKEWMEHNRYNRGKPTGYRQFKTEYGTDMAIEEVILVIEEPMRIRNAEKLAGKDQGIFAKELLEDVFIDIKDGCWRYIVSMAYLTAESQARIRCQEKKK